MNNKKMRIAKVYVHGEFAASLMEENNHYILHYTADYAGAAISLTLPVSTVPYTFETFPAFFDGLLPEGPQLEALLKRGKLDRHDYLGQLIRVGQDLVGAVTIAEEASHE